MSVKVLQEQMAKSVASLEEVTVMAKARVKAYTRKDGTMVKEHDDGRAAAAPKPPSGAGKPKAADPYGHPNVVGKPSKMVRHQWTKETGTKEVPHDGKPTDADEIEFAGLRYRPSNKTGTSHHDGTPVRRFVEDNGTDEGGHYVWLDDQGRVHADSKSEVAGLRAKHEEHAKKGGGGKEKP